LFGWYANIGWFITGESRFFKQTSGALIRPKPQANFWSGDGCELDSHSAGVNWYWNPNARVMFTDITDGPEGTGKLNDVLLRCKSTSSSCGAARIVI